MYCGTTIVDHWRLAFTFITVFNARLVYIISREYGCVSQYRISLFCGCSASWKTHPFCHEKTTKVLSPRTSPRCKAEVLASWTWGWSGRASTCSMTDRSCQQSETTHRDRRASSRLRSIGTSARAPPATRPVSVRSTWQYTELKK